MRLRKFEIKNFKGIEHASFEWHDPVILIGENNVGKSSVLQALQWFLSGAQIKDERLFRDHICDQDHAIEFVGHFAELTEVEKAAQAVRGRLLQDEWVIKKEFWREASDEEGKAGAWKEQYFSYSSRETFQGWPNSDNVWRNFPEPYQVLIEQIPNQGTRSNQATRTFLQQLVREHRSDLITPEPPEWTPNPGGGGNWKSNANSILPQLIPVRAVHDATDEAVSKEGSAYGKIVSLIIEKQLMERQEVIDLRRKWEEVLHLFRPDPEHPDSQAQEIREVEQQINRGLNQVVPGIVSIETTEPDVRPILLPNTELVLQDRNDSIKTRVEHQGHGLQRTLIMTLLQLLADTQSDSQGDTHPIILSVEEPELYMHPQMERKMRDTLYRLALQPSIQVICATHSPVFLDIAQGHRQILRITKNQERRVSFFQATGELFSNSTPERDRLRILNIFNQAFAEIFFASRVVLLEEESAVVAFQRAADLTGIFERHPHVRHDVTLINAHGKGNIPLCQRILNHFQIPYMVIHDEDRGNNEPSGEPLNTTIADLLPLGHTENCRHMVSPTDLETLLGYSTRKDKVYKAICKVETLNASNSLPAEFVRLLNCIYFGSDTEPCRRDQ